LVCYFVLHMYVYGRVIDSLILIVLFKNLYVNFRIVALFTVERLCFLIDLTQALIGLVILILFGFIMVDIVLFCTAQKVRVHF
jgi:hypothetical protein